MKRHKYYFGEVMYNGVNLFKRTVHKTVNRLQLSFCAKAIISMERSRRGPCKASRAGRRLKIKALEGVLRDRPLLARLAK